jgi:hypothetical protein
VLRGEVALFVCVCGEVSDEPEGERNAIVAFHCCCVLPDYSRLFPYTH